QGSVGSCEHHALSAPRHQGRMSVTTRQVAQLPGGGERLLMPSGRNTQQLARFGRVHLHDVRLRFEREPEPVPLAIDGYQEACGPCFDDQVAVALVRDATRE